MRRAMYSVLVVLHYSQVHLRTVVLWTRYVCCIELVFLYIVTVRYLTQQTLPTAAFCQLCASGNSISAVRACILAGQDVNAAMV